MHQVAAGLDVYVHPDGSMIGGCVALFLHLIVDVPPLGTDTRPHAPAQNATSIDTFQVIDLVVDTGGPIRTGRPAVIKRRVCKGIL